MTEIILCKRYYSFKGFKSYEVEPITIEFKSDYAYIRQIDKIIAINRRGQKKLYEILKKRFEK